MTHSGRTMKLGAFLMATGHHIAGWRHPDAEAAAGTEIEHLVSLARMAEAARFDLVFVEDAAGVREADPAIASQTSRSIGFEPITLLAALAARTSRIGLVATASTTYNDPYTVALAFASLDAISGGRSGWNLVTSASEIEAANFGDAGLEPPGDRYERARAFAAAVAGLWRDAAAAANAVPNTARGEQLSVVAGPRLPRSPQGAPVMVQAGASEPGRDLAARTADVVFTAAQTFAEAKAYYDDVKRRLPAYGRRADDLLILPGVSPVVAATEAGARAKLDALQALIPDEVGLALLASYLGVGDLASYPIDGPLPDLPATQAMQSRQTLVVEQARRDGLSIRQVARHFAGARGHWRLVGTPAQIADALERRLRGGAADGFNIMPAFFPGELESFIELVIPELRRRDLVRESYEGTTLRSHLGSRGA